MTKRASASEWAARVRAWHESGQPAKVFAEGKGYPSHLLQWWGSELARREGDKPPMRLARVVPVHAPSATLTVGIGGARIELRAGFDRALLREVIDALRGAP
jgi:hypothetical protein